MYLVEQCTDCSSIFTTDDLAGRFVYELGSGQPCPINVAAAWCDHCDTRRPVEDLDPFAQDGRIAELTSSLNAPVGFFKSISESHKAQSRKDLEELRTLELLKQALISRDSAPKCLHCGSVEIRAIESLVGECFRPNCRGRLIPDEDPIFASTEYALQVYSLTGDLIRSEDLYL